MAIINTFRWLLVCVCDILACLFQQLRLRVDSPIAEELQYHRHHPARAHKVDSLRICRDLSVDVNSVDDSGRTVLHKAAGTLILPAGNLPWRQRRDEEVLHEWITSGDENVSTIEFLLHRGVDVNGIDLQGRTPLHLAVALFEEGECNDKICDLCAMKDVSGLWHNRWACNNQLRVIKTLLKRGANVNAVDSVGRTPLHMAIFAINARHQAPDVFLAERISRITPILKNNALFVSKGKSVDEDSERLVSILVSKGANVNAVDVNGNTPWCLAVDLKRLHMGILMLLINNDAHLDASGKREYARLWNVGENIHLYHLFHDKFIPVSPLDDATPLSAIFQLSLILPLKCLCAHRIHVEEFTPNQFSHLSPGAINFLRMHKKRTVYGMQ